jgi:hypothetical protein
LQRAVVVTLGVLGSCIREGLQGGCADADACLSGLQPQFPRFSNFFLGDFLAAIAY